MNNYLNNLSLPIVSSYPTKISNILNDIFSDLEIQGFSNEFCNLLNYKYANMYAHIVSKHVRIYGYTEEEAETTFNIKSMRYKFACNKIDIDILFDKYHLKYLSSTVKTQLLNNHIVTPVERLETVLTDSDGSFLMTELSYVLTI